MKHLIVIFASIASLAAVAASPNLIECSNKDLEVTYTTSSLDGKPTFNLKKGSEVLSRRGKEIQTQRTVLGTLVTVTKRYIPDHSTQLVTLLVPFINLTEKVQTVEFETTLVETVAKTSFGGPSLVQGVMNPSSFDLVTCKAQQVNF